MTYQLHHGDMLDILPMMERDSIDAIICDPPYGLGFMGKDWDHGVPGEHFWREAYRVAKPGAYLLAFGGTRTFHRLAVAIEDAGWEIRDCVMWVYGQGFPKSHDVSKAIDREAGAEREETGETKYAGFGRHGRSDLEVFLGNAGEQNKHIPITSPATPAAAEWDGWGTALKPAWEPIIVARKPLRGTVAENVLRYGCGSMNIDKCRVLPYTDEYQNEAMQNEKDRGGSKGGGDKEDAKGYSRYELRGLRQADASMEVSDQEGETSYDVRENLQKRDNEGQEQSALDKRDLEGFEIGLSLDENGLIEPRGQGVTTEPECSTGIRASASDGKEVGPPTSENGNGASYQREEERQQAGESLHIGVVTTQQNPRQDDERNSGIESRECPTKRENKTPIGKWPSNLIHDGSAEVLAGFPMTSTHPGAWRNDWSGNKQSRREYTSISDTGSAARFFYCAKASKQDRDEGCEDFAPQVHNDGRDESLASGDMPQNRSNNPDRNYHPTVKPTSLMRYLCRLVTPPAGVILDPFMGSGSTGKAAILEGFNFVGVELEQEYLEIAARRIEHACGKVGIVVDQPMLIESRREVIDRPKQLMLL